MKHSSSLLLLLVFLCVQTLTAQKVMRMPSEYYPPKRNAAILTENKNPLRAGTNSLWIVFSDRDYNQTYEEPNGTPKRLMKFLEAFVVIDESETHLHLVKWEPGVVDLKRDRIVAGAEDFGWAPKSQLLLWRNSLTDPTTGFTLKALTVNSAKSLENRKRYGSGKVLNLFNDPSLSEKSMNKNDVRIFQFLFILKEEGNALLLAKDEQINDPEYVKTEVLGWISKDVARVWDQRLVLEPNFEETAVEERKDKQLSIGVFPTKEDAKSFGEGVMGGDAAIWKEGDYNNVPLPPYMKRFPVLEQFQENVVLTGFVSEVYNNEGTPILSQKDYAHIEKEYNRLRDEFRKVNIMFVVDGTTSMKPYFGAIVNAIDNSKDLLNGSNNDYRLGAVVFRDYPERFCPEGDRMLDQFNLSKQYGALKSFLLGMVEQCYDCRDKDKPEAVLYGMYNGIRQFDRFSDEQSNIVVLIGDVGNRELDLETSMEEVVGLLVKNKCSVLAYQVANANHEAYNDFIFQAQDYILQSSRKLGEATGNTDIKLHPKGNNTYRLNFPEESPVPGALIHPKKGDKMSPEQLQLEIENLINVINGSRELVLEGMESRIKSMGEKKEMTPAMEMFFNQMDLSEEQLEAPKFENFQLFVNGFTPLWHTDASAPLYKYEILVNSDEVFELKRTLRMLTEVQSFDKARQDLIDAYQEILFQHYGRKEGKRMMRKVKLGDIITLVTGLPSKSKLLNEYSLADLESRRTVPDNKLELIIRDVKRKLEILEEEIEDNNRFRFRSNDVTYYWLPQEALP